MAARGKDCAGVPVLLITQSLETRTKWALAGLGLGDSGVEVDDAELPQPDNKSSALQKNIADRNLTTVHPISCGIGAQISDVN